eukprot:TRINITY_DN6182_c0_g1_i1.p1 TRINITY_DN6182_c0_g1~~TRINITY_DN6182_c0_g1_i1.p1  ORF type:complete len:440 (-),score=62.48 TRINITY_DN6182_c0_g1_i1:35-1354(-)
MANRIKKKPHYEFGGVPGSIFLTVGLPLGVYALYFLCYGEQCLQNPLDFDYVQFVQSLPFFSLEGLYSLFSYEATAMYLGWILFQVFLERTLAGEILEGTVLSDGTRLKYCMSGHLQFWISVGLLVIGKPIFNSNYALTGFKPYELYLIYDHFVGLITIACLFSLVLSIYLYVSSFAGEKILAHGDEYNGIYCFFMGRELNPRLFGVDLKCFCELRPGLIGWTVINLGMASKQYQIYGSVSMSMVLVVLFNFIYVWDALYYERAILTTMDITTDGFGYMLAFGDLAWVPFIYTIQARYLVDYDPNLEVYQLVLFTLIHFLGLYIFRRSNYEKDTFRRNPNDPAVQHLRYLKTERGTNLLVSGWWGLARKINYTGDWLMVLSLCLLCGFSSPVPYFQALYFFILLVHRAMRDDYACMQKYGQDWVKYKKEVPYVFIPYVI